MKAFIIGVAAAVILAVAVAVGLQMADRSAAQQYSTDSVRL